MSANSKNAEWLEKLRQEYLSTADRKLSDLCAAVDAYIHDTTDPGAREDLHRLLHNLTGSGGSYGFPEVSSSAERMSRILKRSRAAEPPVIGDALMRKLQPEIARLRRAFGRD